MAPLYLLNLRLNICIGNDSSIGSEAFSLTEMIWFHLNSSWNTVDEIKSRSQEKHVKLSSKFTLISRNELFISMQSTIFKQASYLCVPSSLFCFSRKVTSKNLPLVSCFFAFLLCYFCWQSAEIRLPYLLGSIYTKWLALTTLV